jgi:RHS repeat-associated protein
MADYSYNAMSRLTDLIQRKASGNITYGYTLNADGSRHSALETLPGGQHNVAYTYDNINRLTAEAATGIDEYTVDYAHDLVGNRQTRTVNGGLLETTYTYYDGTDKLWKEEYTAPSGIIERNGERYYAYNNGGSTFFKDSGGRVVNGFKVYMMGLPGWVADYYSIAVSGVPAVLLLILCIFAMAARVRGIRRKVIRWQAPKVSICLLLAYIMLLGPEGVNQIAYGSYISSGTWGQSNRTIEYTYDANGSVLTKTTKITPSTVIESVTYDYDVAGKLTKVTTDITPGISTDALDVTEYGYNDEGIRVKAYSYELTGQVKSSKKTTVYLPDEYNHTGYSQTLEERVYNSDVTTGTPGSITTYLIGDDVVAQKKDGVVSYMLYDGHGSTRQLASIAGDMSVSVSANYSYDAYGVMLGGNPTPAAPAATNLLYTGEYYDNDMMQYNLRARWYDTLNGRFNQMDSYTGDNEDPPSLHKYLYCYADPINNIDPTGMFSFSEISVTQLVSNMLRRIDLGAVYGAYNFADTTISAVDLVNQWRSSGRVDYLALGLLAASILPLGKLLGKVRISANKLLNASKDLTKLLEQGGRTNKVVQTIGELGAELTARAKGFKTTNFVKRYHGFDGIYKNGERFVVVEAKGGTGQLAEGQMSKKWIRERIEKMIEKDPGNSALAKELKQAWAENAVDGMVVTTEIVGNKVKDPEFVYKAFKEIGDTTF